MAQQLEAGTARVYYKFESGQLFGYNYSTPAMHSSCCKKVSALVTLRYHPAQQICDRAARSLGCATGWFRPRSCFRQPWAGAPALPLIGAQSRFNDTPECIGGNGFKVPRGYSAGFQPDAVLAGDFNADTILDLAVANESSNDVSILLGNQDSTFQQGQNYAVGEWPKGVAAGDVNHDGKLDLATASFVPGTVSVLLGNGDGTFQGAKNYQAHDNPNECGWAVLRVYFGWSNQVARHNRHA